MKAKIDCDSIYLGLLQERWSSRNKPEMRKNIESWKREYIKNSNYTVNYIDIANCWDMKRTDSVTTYDCSGEFLEIGQFRMMDSDLDRIKSKISNLTRQAVLDSGGTVPIGAVGSCLKQAEQSYNEIKKNSNISIIFLVVTCIIALIGLIGNAALFHTFWKKNRKIRFNVLMITLSVFDTLYLSMEVTADSYDFSRGIIWNDMPFSDLDLIHFVLDYLRLSLFGCSVFTVVSIAVERVLVTCGFDTDKYSIAWTIIPIIILAFTLEIPVLFHGKFHKAKKIVFLCGISIVPSITMLTFNLLHYIQLKCMKSSDLFNVQAKNSLRKSIFKAKMSFFITMTFVGSQLTGWLSLYFMVRDKIFFQIFFQKMYEFSVCGISTKTMGDLLIPKFKIIDGIQLFFQLLHLQIFDVEGQENVSN